MLERASTVQKPGLLVPRSLYSCCDRKLDQDPTVCELPPAGRTKQSTPFVTLWLGDCATWNSCRGVQAGSRSHCLNTLHAAHRRHEKTRRSKPTWSRGLSPAWRGSGRDMICSREHAYALSSSWRSGQTRNGRVARKRRASAYDVPPADWGDWQKPRSWCQELARTAIQVGYGLTGGCNTYSEWQTTSDKLLIHFSRMQRAVAGCR